MKDLKQELEDRWFLHQFTNEKVFEEFEKWGNNFYFWVDCSADSMTIWNFVALMMAIHFMLKGNKCYLLVWWATSTIGNPSGKDNERPILSEDDLARNQAWITKQFKLLIDNVEKINKEVTLKYEIVNNYDFFKDMNVLDYLREVGRYMTVNWMMSKDIVKKRITDPNQFISYAEFSYMLIMGYDFYHLNKNHDVTLEVWGSDEWDGILSGIELIWKKTWKEAYWVTNKLIMDANGKKFWKSEWNAIWLDAEKTSPYEMYQYFMNTLDEDIERYLKLFTFDSEDTIAKIVKTHNLQPEKRYGQKSLAQRVVELIHWTESWNIADLLSGILFWWDKVELQEKLWRLASFWEDSFQEVFKEIWGITFKDQNLFELFIESGLEKSWGTTRQSLSSWALYINEEKITDSHYDFSNDFIEWKFLLLRKWKKNFRLIIK